MHPRRATLLSSQYRKGDIIATTATPVLRFESLSRMGIPHGITSRDITLPANGDFSYVSGPDADSIRRNRAAWCREVGVAFDRLVCGRQVHGVDVAIVDDRHAGRGALSAETALLGFDALVTETPGLPLAVLSADCATLLFYDPVRNVAAATHAGWRGAVAGVAAATIETMRSHFGADPADLVIGIGPAICAACYQVGDEVIDAWTESAYAANGNVAHRREDGWRFDIVEANVVTLEAHGVTRSQIELSAVCTRCAGGRYFSRRGIGPRTGLFASIIALPASEASGTGTAT